jgi:ABC-type transport system involved in multi-copper enzyme maturation permease subunit
MHIFLALIRNEILKVLRRRRFAIVIGILVAILSIVSYAQYRQLRNQQDRNWRADLQQRVASYNNQLRRTPPNSPWARSLQVYTKRLQFYLDHDIQPDKPTAPSVVRGFANVAGVLLLPLLISVLGSDIVSAEHAEGTDKLLLTRPVRRWKILASKLVTLWIFSTLTLLCGALLAFVIFHSSAASIGTMLASLIGGTILTRLAPDWTAAKYLFVSALPLADYYTGEPPPYDGMSMAFCIGLLAAWAAAATVAAFAMFTRRDVFG